MRSGKENGISFPVTPGSTGQVLVSNGNGVISWANIPVPTNMVTTDTTQTITGAKTFSAKPTTFGVAGSGGTLLTTPNSYMSVEQTGSTMGTTRLTLLNESDRNGAQIEQLGNFNAVDLILMTPVGSGNLRFEKRPTSFMDATNQSYEFQFGPATVPAFSFGDTVSQVNSPTLKVSGKTVYHTGNIGGFENEVMYRIPNGGIDSAEFMQIEGGYLKLITGLPNAAQTGGVVIGAKDLAGRIMPAFVGPYGLDVTVQAGFANNRIAMLVPIIGATAPTAIGQTVTATGTATARSLATTNMFTSLPRVGYVGGGGVTGSIGGFRTNQQWWRGSVAYAGGFFYSCTFALTNATAQASGRAFVGLYSSTAASSNTEPSNLTNCIGICRSTSSNNWMIHGANGTANSVMIDLGSNFPAGTVSSDVYRFMLFAPPNSSIIGWRVMRLNAVDPATNQPYTASGTITNSSQMPTNSVFLAAYGWSSTGTLSGTAGIDLVGLYVETDN